MEQMYPTTTPTARLWTTIMKTVNVPQVPCCNPSNAFLGLLRCAFIHFFNKSLINVHVYDNEAQNRSTEGCSKLKGP